MKDRHRTDLSVIAKEITNTLGEDVNKVMCLQVPQREEQVVSNPMKRRTIQQMHGIVGSMPFE